MDSSEADGQKDDSVSLNRVMKWNKLSDAKSSGLTNSKVITCEPFLRVI